MIPRPRTLLSAAVAPLLALALTTPASAAPGPQTIPLPDSSSPEGISDGPGTTVFAGSRNTGSIWVADVTTGQGRYLVQPQAPVAGTTRVVGLDHDQANGLVFTAGGTTGLVNGFDVRDGSRDVSVRVPGDGASRFLNDVAATGSAVYVTDSRNPELVSVRLGKGASPARARLVRLKGDYVQPQGFGANGIVALPDGQLLIVSGGVLYEVDPQSGQADRLEQTGGPALTSGDGLELVGSTLYVTYGFTRNSIAVVQLGRGAETFAVTGELRDSDLDRPTTSAVVDGELYAVNGKFQNPSATTFEVVRVDLP